MSQKRYGVDQMIPMLRRADFELGKGKKVPEVCKLLGLSHIGTEGPADSCEALLASDRFALPKSGAKSDADCA